MKIGGRFASDAKQAARGFTLLETLVSVLLASITLSALYACFAGGWNLIRVTSQDLRATQILLQRMERIRLCDFSQATDQVLNPSSSKEYFDPKNQNAGGGGVSYAITCAITTPSSGSLPEAYRTNMLLVSVAAWWTNGTQVFNRSMETYVARDGMQSYVVKGQ